ncbi:hypothetical protein QJQ45_009262 [Haematococcus lacustris]|nr:hypothetical protein QJQ45_009262 [Haematococcus lacustris]
MNTSASQSDSVRTRHQMAAAAAELPFQRIAKCWNGTALPTCVVEQFWPMFFVCAEIPFNKVGNKYLEDALTLVGIPMRSDSSLLNGDLDKRYEEVNSLVKLKVDRLDASGVTFERNWSAWGRLYTAARNRLGMERAKKLIFIKANADCYGCNGGADAELLALMGDAAHVSIGSEEQAYGDRLVRDPVQCSGAPTSTQRQERSVAVICPLNCMYCCGDVLGDAKPAMRVPSVVQPAMRVPWVVQPAMRVPWVVQPAMRVPWVVQPAMRVPSVVQPAMRVPWVVQPAMRVPWVVQPAMRVPLELQPAMRVHWELQPAMRVPWELQPALRLPEELQPALRLPWELQPAPRVPWELQPALMVLRRYANALTTKLAFVAEPSPALPSLTQPPGVDPEPSPSKFYDRDVSAALNIRRCAVGPGPRPTELCYWDGRPAMPKPGRPGQEWVYLRDKALLRKWRRKWRR